LTAFTGACDPSSSPEVSGAEATSDDAMTVVMSAEPLRLDPRYVVDASGLRISRLLFASLVTIDPISLDVVPDLAEELTVEDELRYRVRLRPGLRFADGSTLDADDVVATFASVVDPAVQSRYAATYRRITRVERIDARTVRFVLDAPHATFVTDLEIPVLRAEDALAPVDGPSQLPIGAGPYRLTRREHSFLDLAPNPHWHRGRPAMPHVRIVVIHDDNTRALRLLSGAGDIALDAIPPLLVPLFEDNPAFTVRRARGIGTVYLGLQLEHGALADRRVRIALAHAIDREALIAAKLDGRASLARGFVPPGHWAHDGTLETYPYDPERARRLLREAGAANLSLRLRTTTDRARLSLARALAAMLSGVGIEVQVRPSEKGTLLADLKKGQFDLALMEIPEVFEPHVLSWFFGSDRIPSGDAEGANRWRFRDAALDRALERGRSTVDRAARIAAYAEVQRILARELPVIPLYHPDVVAVLSRRARGFAVPRDGRLATLASAPWGREGAPSRPAPPGL
jgi:peptide/nickel transport system substrate-binding protein